MINIPTTTATRSAPPRQQSRMTLRIPLGGDAPNEVRLFIYGENETTKGTFVFDGDSAESVMAADSDYGNERSADYEHQALYDPPIEAPASAWYRLELRGDGLYAVDIRWTERARRMIEAGEYRYISPAFTYDPETSRIMSIINFALTNLPATKRMEALLRADPLSDFVASNYETLDAAGLMDNGAMTPRQRIAMDALHSGARLYVDAFPMTDSEDSGMDEEMGVGGKKKKPDYMSSTVDIIENETLSGSSPLQGADSSRRTSAPTPIEKDDTMEPEIISTILAALGLSDDATPEQITQAVATLRAPAPKLEPKTDPLESVRVALGLDTGNSRVVTEAITMLKAENAQLAQQVESYRQIVDEQTIDVIMAGAREAGKVTPVTEKLYLDVVTDDYGRVDTDKLKTLIDGLPKVVALGAAHKEPVNTKADYSGKTWADLTPTEKRNLADEDWDLYQTLRAEHNGTKN